MARRRWEPRSGVFGVWKVQEGEQGRPYREPEELSLHNLSEMEFWSEAWHHLTLDAGGRPVFHGERPEKIKKDSWLWAVAVIGGVVWVRAVMAKAMRKVHSLMKGYIFQGQVHRICWWIGSGEWGKEGSLNLIPFTKTLSFWTSEGQAKSLRVNSLRVNFHFFPPPNSAWYHPVHQPSGYPLKKPHP